MSGGNGLGKLVDNRRLNFHRNSWGLLVYITIILSYVHLSFSFLYSLLYFFLFSFYFFFFLLSIVCPLRLKFFRISI